MRYWLPLEDEDFSLREELAEMIEGSAVAEAELENRARQIGDQLGGQAEAGALWCRHASNHAKTTGAKPWKYLLIPHDQVTEDKRLVDYLSFEAASR